MSCITMVPMNRRGFLRAVGLAAASFTILPGATTYVRRWKPSRAGLYLPNPEWVNAEYEMAWMCEPHFAYFLRHPVIPILHLREPGTAKDGQWDTNRHRPSKETE